MKFVLLAIMVAQMMGGHQPAPMSPQEFAATHAGQNAQIEVRVQRVNRTTVTAELLQHETDTQSKATGKTVTLYLPDGTPVIMGSAGDIGPGALLFVNGVVTAPGHIDVKRVVVLTKYLTVE
jgi:hypothetical protein